MSMTTSRPLQVTLRCVQPLCAIVFLFTCEIAKAHQGLTFLSDADWISQAASVARNACVAVDGIEMEATRRLGSLGFQAESDPNAWDRIPGPDGPRFASPRDEAFCKFAELGEEVTLVPLMGIGQVVRGPLDTVAIVSIDRHGKKAPYLYETLKSLFQEFPEESHFNVLIGNDDTSYVSWEALTSEFGTEKARRIHSFSPPQGVTQFLHKNFDRIGWATWNHGRALRSYRGSAALLLLEDDVVFSRGSLSQVERWLVDAPPPVISLYNYYCRLLPGASASPTTTRKLLSYPARALDWEFARTQAMVYDASVARNIGNYLSVRLGKRPLDLMVDEWMRYHDVSLGFSQPSVVQHIGDTTTGLGHAHKSRCFSAVFGVLD